MRIRDLLSIDTIDLTADAKDKNDAVVKACNLMLNSGVVEDGSLFQEAVFKREKEFTTGIGHNLAIPHARGSFIKKPHLAAMIFKNGVDYESLDNQPVKLLFLIAAPETKGSENLHLDVLARLSKMLLDEAFLEKLMNTQDKNLFLELINQKEAEVLKSEEERDLEMAKMSQAPQQAEKNLILAITSCPTGIAHTYMAQEALENAAKELNVPIKVETQGSAGAKNIISQSDIDAAVGIIIAADTNVDLSRFDNMKMIKTSVTSGIKKPKELINKMTSGKASVYKSGVKKDKKDDSSNEKVSFKQGVYKNLMSGISHMLPFVIAGGILIAISFIIDSFYGSSSAGSSFGKFTEVSRFFNTLGGAAFTFLYPILGGFIAFSIAGRPALAVGMISGWLANLTTFQVVNSGSNAGFLGAIVAGFVAGFLILLLQKSFNWLPKSIDGLKPMLIYPLVGTLVMGLLMYFVINTPLGYLNFYIKVGLEAVIGKNSDLSLAVKIGIGVLLAGMMAVDMGGPINKVAYTIGLSSIDPNGINQPFIMASVMIGGMIPPIIIALSADLFPQKYSENERKNSKVNYLMGLSFITEGAIPYAAKDPIRVIFASVISSAIAGGMSAGLGAAVLAPHGGIFVLAVVTNWYFYLLSFVVASVIGAIILGFLKPNLADNPLGKWKGIPIGNGIHFKTFVKWVKKMRA